MSPRKPRTSPIARGHRKPLLSEDVSYVDFKNVTLLRTFISDRGKIRSRRVTGITPQQQRMVSRAIKNAREMALLPYSSR